MIALLVLLLAVCLMLVVPCDAPPWPFSLYLKKTFYITNRLDFAVNCDADKNGIRYMIFTRVILGNVEPLYCGSEQWHCSDEKYDSGVDDLENPTHYVVWNMNFNTHIYPECVELQKSSMG